MKKNPKGFFKYWGIYCWHAFSTNPKKIELQISEDNEYYYSLGNYELRMKPGKQSPNLCTVRNTQFFYIFF